MDLSAFPYEPHTQPLGSGSLRFGSALLDQPILFLKYLLLQDGG